MLFTMTVALPLSAGRINKSLFYHWACSASHSALEVFVSTGLGCFIMVHVSCHTPSLIPGDRCHIAISTPLMTSFIVALGLGMFVKLRSYLIWMLQLDLKWKMWLHNLTPPFGHTMSQWQKGINRTDIHIHTSNFWLFLIPTMKHWFSAQHWHGWEHKIL